MTSAEQEAEKQEQGGEKHPIEIFVNNKPVQVPHDELTGAEIKAAAGVPPDFSLFHEQGGKLIPVGDDETVKVHPNERFRAVSGQDVS
jgi:Multiubiquitin